MELFDKVYDKDAHIYGIIIDNFDNKYRVLWDNSVIGILDENEENIDIVDHLDMHRYTIEDIYYTNKENGEYISKVGDKYEGRKHKTIFLNVERLKPGEEIVLKLFNQDDINKITEVADEVDIKHLLTTPFVKIYNDDKYRMLQTNNSIYKLREF